MNRIATLRKQRGLSQASLAQILGIAQNTVSQYENEARNLPAAVITELSKFFDVTPQYLLCLPECNSESTEKNKTYDLQSVTLIKEIDDIEEVNLRLRLGWRLLHIGDDSYKHEDGSGYSRVKYILGYFGNPNDTICSDLPSDPRHKYAYDPEVLD